MVINTKHLPDIEEEIYSLVDRGLGSRSEILRRFIDLNSGFVNRFCHETGLDEDLLHDIYIDSVLLVFEHVESGKFKRQSKLSTYLFRLYYFKVIDEIRKSGSGKVIYTDKLPEYPDPVLNAAGTLEGLETMKRVVRVLDSMCLECKELILDWAYIGYDLEEIRNRMGFDSPARFNKFKFTCLKKFKAIWESLPPED